MLKLKSYLPFSFKPTAKRFIEVNAVRRLVVLIMSKPHLESVLLGYLASALPIKDVMAFE